MPLDLYSPFEMQRVRYAEDLLEGRAVSPAGCLRLHDGAGDVLLSALLVPFLAVLGRTLLAAKVASALVAFASLSLWFLLVARHHSAGAALWFGLLWVAGPLSDVLIRD
jgi:hypothetical protein